MKYFRFMDEIVTGGVGHLEGYGGGGISKFEMRKLESALLRSVSVNLAELRRAPATGGATKGLRKKVLKERNFLGFRWFNLI